jgi:SARP family transcriptional regulator, regulator of embCAB operon
LESVTRIHLAGEVSIEHDQCTVTDWRRVGRQGRLAFAFLVAEHWRSIPRDELIGELWPENAPPSSDRALSAVMSKLRSLLDSGGMPAFEIATAFGCYQMRLPRNVWIDVEAAAEGIDQAEGAMRANRYRDAWGPAQIACHIARRPFLLGDDGPWATRMRTNLEEILVRAYESLSEIFVWSGEPATATRYATLAVEVEPFRETAHQRLMRAHAAAGNRAEALRAYERCRCLLSDELGVSPSPQTEAVYMEILQS